MKSIEHEFRACFSGFNYGIITSDKFHISACVIIHPSEANPWRCQLIFIPKSVIIAQMAKFCPIWSHWMSQIMFTTNTSWSSICSDRLQPLKKSYNCSILNKKFGFHFSPFFSIRKKNKIEKVFHWNEFNLPSWWSSVFLIVVCFFCFWNYCLERPQRWRKW